MTSRELEDILSSARFPLDELGAFIYPIVGGVPEYHEDEKNKFSRQNTSGSNDPIWLLVD